MSILSKIFVVLVTILSIMLAALLIPFVSNTEQYQKQRDQALALRDVAEAAAKIAEAEVSALQEKASQRETTLSAENDQLKSQISALEATVASQTIAITAEKQQNARMKADLTRLAAAHDQNVTLLNKVQTELKEKRDAVVVAERKNIELADTNTELESQVQVYRRKTDVDGETIQALEEHTAELELILSKVPEEILNPSKDADLANTEGEAAKFTVGKITMVKEQGGIVLAQINLGKVDGIRENIQFRVHRGNQFLGRLIVTAVDDRAAAGRIELKPVDATIQVGDGVQSGGVLR